MIIDIHGHVVAPPELYAYQSSLMASRGAHGRGKVNVSDEKLMNAIWGSRQGEKKTHIELLNEVGTDIQFISPRPFHAMHAAKPEKIVHWYTEEANNLIARVCKLFPNRFLGIAGLPQNADVSPVNVLVEMERCIKELGFVGVMLNPDPNEGIGTPPPGLGDEYWYPVYEKAVELDIPILIHSASCQSHRESYSLHFINEETIAVISLLNSKVFEMFPTLKIVISHAGGAVPYQIGRFMAGRYRTNSEPFEQSIRKLYFDTCLYTKDSLELLFKTVGVDRCMFGTENPGTGSAINPNTGMYMDNTRPVIESIEWLTQEDKKKIFSETAIKVYNLQLR
ncbi:amidohydrolase family protein [Brevibacillus sp. NRS-1366]|uniref:amidohydrolase family protein n=1 Tax=Brevibacillus sp. NRS-1366 TaxID=3233899 RepID=UPI003D262C34